MEPTVTNPYSRSPLAMVIIVVLIAVAIGIAVWLRQLNLVNLPGYPRLIPANLTDSQKREVLATADPITTSNTAAKLTKTDKQKLLEAVAPPGGSTPLSNQAKTSLLDQLDPQ